MTSGTGTTPAHGPSPGDANTLLGLAAREAQAAHRGTDAILTMMQQAGGEDGSDDPVAAITELVIQCTEDVAVLTSEVEQMGRALGEVREGVGQIRTAQAAAVAREEALRLDVQALTARLDELLGRIRPRPPGDAPR